MKNVISVLILVALMLPAVAYNETELDLFASGVVAATDPDANWNVTDGMIIVARPANSLEINDIDFAYRGAKDLSIAADTIAQHFPGEFSESGGTIVIGPRPYVGIVIYYPVPA